MSLIGAVRADEMARNDALRREKRGRVEKWLEKNPGENALTCARATGTSQGFCARVMKERGMVSCGKEEFIPRGLTTNAAIRRLKR